MSTDDLEREDRAIPHWREDDREVVLETRVFDVVQRRMQEDGPQGRSGTFVNIRPPDWVNVVALTPDRKLILIEQFRHGIDMLTLEIPGGMIDPGETPLEAARRELAEETGFVADHWSRLGMVHPNPAIQTNRTFTYLARNARRDGDPRFDDNEACRLALASWPEALELVSKGRITHSLVICALHFAARELG